MFRYNRIAALVGLALVVGATGGEVVAQTPAPAPAPAPQTFWNRLGIPSQPLTGIRNREGNFPGMERKPPLKKIADPANLASDNAAIKKAAEIKTQEDMAQQKIKAIKYLAEIGCGGCYPGVDKALSEALDDCTEAVRYEAVQAILAASACGENECIRKCVRKTKSCKEAACDCWVGCMKRTCATMHLLCGKPGPDGVTLKSKCPGYGCGVGGNCPGSRCACGDGNCCTSEILNKLSTMAYEKDDRGCWKEPSPRVRAMARQALQACRPNIRPMTADDIPVPEAVPLNVEPVKPPVTPEPSGDAKPEASGAGASTTPAASAAEELVASIERIQADENSADPQVSDGPAVSEASVLVTTDAVDGSPIGAAAESPNVDIVSASTVAVDVGQSLVSVNEVASLEVPVAPDPDDLFPAASAKQRAAAHAHRHAQQPKQSAAKGFSLPLLWRR